MGDTPGLPLKGEGKEREGKEEEGKEGRGNCAVVNFP